MKGKHSQQVEGWEEATHLGPEEPLKVGGLVGLGQAKAVVDGHQLELAAVQAREGAEVDSAVARAAHQDVARMAVGVPDADVQDADAVDIARSKARCAHLARVAVVVHVLLPYQLPNKVAATMIIQC